MIEAKATTVGSTGARVKTGGPSRVWQDRTWQSADGLTLHYRDYPGPEGRDGIPALCIPGLTRNTRDFDDLARHLSMQRRVISVDLRGRGDSEYAKDVATYNPVQYAQDLLLLFPAAGVDRAVLIGSSLGGLVTLVMARIAPERIAGAVINDIGPVIEPRGLERIDEQVGIQRTYPTWMHAARALQETRAESYPEWSITDWLAEAKRVMELGNNGRITFDYDMRIGDGFARRASEFALSDEAQAGLWAGYDALAGRPVLVVRGENSDILSARTALEMAGRFPGAELVGVPRVGHLPLLTEPEALAAIDRLFEERLPTVRAAR